MSKSKTLSVALAIVGIMSAVAVAATVETFRTRSKGASAVFFIGDDCQAAFTVVNYAEAVIKTNGTTEVQTPLLFLEIDYVNNCTGDHIIMTGVSTNVQGQINGNITKGTVSGDVTVANDTGTKSATFHVSINFTGSGPLSSVSDKSKSKEGNVVMKSDFTFQSRSAEATGSITGIMPLDSGGLFTNLTQGPSMSASLGQNRFGQITITTKN